MQLRTPGLALKTSHTLCRWRPAVAALALLSACGPVASGPAAPLADAAQLSAVCTHVVDGDSLYLEGFRPQIRLWGVDAPERDEPGYQAARDALQKMALHQSLRCEAVDIDKYRRLVARCFVKTGRSAGVEVNRALIESGVATEYCWFSKGYYGHCKK